MTTKKVVCDMCGIEHADEDSVKMVEQWLSEDGYAPCPNIGCPGQMKLVAGGDRETVEPHEGERPEPVPELKSTITLDGYEKWTQELDRRMADYDTATSEEQERLETVQRELVNAELKRVLNGRKMEYISADWKDIDGLISGILGSEFNLQHATRKAFEPFYEIAKGSHGGSDDYVVIAIEGKATEDELDIVYDLVHNLGAELEEPKKPICPECGKEIDCLVGSAPAFIPERAFVLDGRLETEFQDGLKVSDLVDEGPPRWCCPKCDEELFNAADPDCTDKMLVFLKGG